MQTSGSYPDLVNEELKKYDGEVCKYFQVDRRQTVVSKLADSVGTVVSSAVVLWGCHATIPPKKEGALRDIPENGGGYRNWRLVLNFITNIKVQVYNTRKIPDEFPILVGKLQNFTTIHECSEACRCHVINSIIAKANRKIREKNIVYCTNFRMQSEIPSLG